MNDTNAAMKRNALNAFLYALQSPHAGHYKACFGASTTLHLTNLFTPTLNSETLYVSFVSSHLAIVQLCFQHKSTSPVVLSTGVALLGLRLQEAKSSGTASFPKFFYSQHLYVLRDRRVPRCVMVCSAFQPLKKRGFRQTCTQLFVISQLRLLYVDAPIPIRRQNEQIIIPIRFDILHTFPSPYSTAFIPSQRDHRTAFPLVCGGCSVVYSRYI